MNYEIAWCLTHFRFPCKMNRPKNLILLYLFTGCPENPLFLLYKRNFLQIPIIKELCYFIKYGKNIKRMWCKTCFQPQMLEFFIEDERLLCSTLYIISSKVLKRRCCHVDLSVQWSLAVFRFSFIRCLMLCLCLFHCRCFPLLWKEIHPLTLSC